METKHTPGPWHTGRNTVVRNTIVYDSAGNAICDCKTFHGQHDDQAGSDNAALIAAAPELLGALQMICDSGIPLADEIEKKMLAAITKATA